MTSHSASAGARPGRDGAGSAADAPGPVAHQVFRSRRVVLPDGERAASVHVREGRIVGVGDYDDVPSDSRWTDAGALALLPGLVDTHVHINEPGRSEWEGFDTATRAAASGGVTTLIDMPLNSLPPVTDVAALEIKRRAAAACSRVDVGFWAGAIPGNENDRSALHAAGAFGFKAFLCDSGVPEFPPLVGAALERAVEQIAALGTLLLVHAEWPAALDAARAAAPAGASDPRRHATWLATRPAEAESEAVVQVVALARRTGARVHIVHVSSAAAVRQIAAARTEGVRITAETCPHYLTLAAEEVPDGATAFKCAPPIRAGAEREALWEALGHGALDAVVTDHSPSPPEGKRLESGDFLVAWGGIASLGLALPVVWTEARRRGVALAHVVRWLGEGPARIAGLAATKGAIAPGRDADLVIFDPDAELVVDAAALRFRHPLTPYAGRRLRGVVHGVWLRGEPIVTSGRPLDTPRGRLLERP